MQIPMQVSSDGVDLTPEQRAMVTEAAGRLERYSGQVISCHVSVSVPNRRMRGDPVAWSSRVALTVPGAILTVTRQEKPSFAEALNESFDAARRRLQDHVREMRGDVKVRAAEAHGTVSRLFSYEGFGFISTDDGEDVYFHRNSVPGGGFERLTLGAKVRFVETEGQDGPQASTVVPIGSPA